MRPDAETTGRIRSDLRAGPRAASGAAVAAAFACVASLAACGSIDSALPSIDAPEGEFVEAAPWPRLIDGPAVAPDEGAGSPEAIAAEGESLRQAADADAAALRAAEAQMRARQVVGPSVDVDAARLRARAQELMNQP